MIPPTFSDLGKSAKDLFSKGFDIGLVKLDHKGKTSAGLEVSTSGTHNMAKGDATASLEGKYKIVRHGITFKEKWDTSNVIKFDIEIEDKLIDGLKQTFSSSFEPHTGKKSAAIKSDFKAKYVATNLDMNFAPKLQGINGSLVVALPQPHGCLAGICGALDTEKQALKSIDFAVSMLHNDVTFFGKYVDRNDVEASIYQRHSSQLETGLQMNWTRATQATRFGGVVKYQLDDKSFFKIKVDNTSLMGLCYSFPAGPSVNLTISGEIDGKNFENGGHRLGLSLDFTS